MRREHTRGSGQRQAIFSSAVAVTLRRRDAVSSQRSCDILAWPRTDDHNCCPHEAGGGPVVTALGDKNRNINHSLICNNDVHASSDEIWFTFGVSFVTG